MTFVGAFAAGLLLFLSDQPLGWWPLQFVALVPWWIALIARRLGGRHLWPLGLCFAGGYAIPLLGVVGLAPPILVAALAAALQWTLTAMVCGRLLVRSPILGALCAAAAMTLLEVAVWFAVPMFGTAQCFARPLSAAPATVSFIAFTGVAGLVFALAATQALAVNAVRWRRSGPAWFAVGLTALLAVLDMVRWNRPLGAPMRVAAYGWGEEPPIGLGWIDRAMADARSAGAVLLVTPETGFGTGMDREQALQRLGGLAKQHGLAAAFGVWHHPTRDNRVWLFDAEGSLAAEYRKTHLVPWLEDYAPGDGTLGCATVGGVPVGCMICQDDNFTDLARGYGCKAVALMAVPTNDWAAIRAFHLENALFRAIENGYAVVRAASHGISALVSPRGGVIASCDHIASGPALITADVPAGDGSVTMYARCGEWPVLGLCALLLALAFRRVRG